MTTYAGTSLKELTSRQREVLQFITSYADSMGYPPSQREIAGHLNVSGTLPVMKHLDALERKGYLTRESVNRGLRLAGSQSRHVSLPIAGTVKAGQLSTAIEDIQGYFSVDQMAVKGEGCFFLKISGDSMITAGIIDGDLALIRPQKTALDREIVVAMVDGEATVKRFFRESGQIRLQPENPTMEPIIVRPEDGDLCIVGRVIGIYRQL